MNLCRRRATERDFQLSRSFTSVGKLGQWIFVTFHAKAAQRAAAVALLAYTILSTHSPVVVNMPGSIDSIFSNLKKRMSATEVSIVAPRKRQRTELWRDKQNEKELKESVSFFREAKEKAIREHETVIQNHKEFIQSMLGVRETYLEGLQLINDLQDVSVFA